MKFTLHDEYIAVNFGSDEVVIVGINMLILILAPLF